MLYYKFASGGADDIEDETGAAAAAIDEYAAAGRRDESFMMSMMMGMGMGSLMSQNSNRASRGSSASRLETLFVAFPWLTYFDTHINNARS